MGALKNILYAPIKCCGHDQSRPSENNFGWASAVGSPP